MNTSYKLVHIGLFQWRYESWDVNYGGLTTESWYIAWSPKLRHDANAIAGGLPHLALLITDTVYHGMQEILLVVERCLQKTQI